MSSSSYTKLKERVMSLLSTIGHKDACIEMLDRSIKNAEKEIIQLERANVELYFDGLKFHKWLIENNWMEHSNGRWYRSKDRHQWPPEEVCTEIELIHKYKQYVSKC